MPKPDLIEAYETWAYSQDKAPSRDTLRKYIPNLRSLERECIATDRPMAELTRDELKTYVAGFRDLPAGSQSHRFAAIKGFYKFLKATGLREDNPAAGLRQPSRKPLPRSRPGQVSRKLDKLSTRDQLIADFLRELFRDDKPKLGDVFKIQEEPPVDRRIAVRDSKRQPRVFVLSDRARRILDELGGSLGQHRTFQRHLAEVGLSPKQLMYGSRAEVTVELHPTFEDLLHSVMSQGQYETAAQDAFKQIEEELRDLTGTQSYGRHVIEEAFGLSGALAYAFDTDTDRQSMRMLLAGAFGYFRNELAHRRILYDNPMYAKEVVLFADLLLRELREIGTETPDG